MKYVNLLSYAGAIMIIVGSLSKIFHIEILNPSIILTLGLALAFIGSGMKSLITKGLIDRQKQCDSTT